MLIFSDIWLPPGTQINSLNGRVLEESSIPGRRTRLISQAPDTAGVRIECTLPATARLQFRLMEKQMGMPASLLTHEQPPGIIFDTDNFSNIIFTKKTVDLD